MYVEKNQFFAVFMVQNKIFIPLASNTNESRAVNIQENHYHRPPIISLMLARVAAKKSFQVIILLFHSTSAKEKVSSSKDVY